MDQDPGKKSGDGGSSGNALVLLMTFLAGALLIRQLPLSDSRPSTPEPTVYSYVAANRVDARLWQDPLGAVARGIKERSQGAADAAKVRSDTPGSDGAQTLRAWLAGHAQPQPVVLGVMVPGGAYPGYAEWRRKARYAVLSGLATMGYTPTDPEHLEYFKLDADLRTALVGTGGASAQPAAQFVAFEWLDAGMPPPMPSADGVRAVPVAGEASGERRVLVLWLDQDMFWGARPIQGISRLLGHLFPMPAPKTPRNAAAMTAEARRQSVIILGPGDSTLLRHMVEEAGAQPTDATTWPVLPVDLQFYDYGATATDAALLPSAIGSPHQPSLHEYFADRNLAVFRTIGDDEQLACALRDELALRGIDLPGAGLPSQPPLDAPAVVLISEWDTDYGRAISGITRSALTGTTPCPPGAKGRDDGRQRTARDVAAMQWVGTYTYLRGLDGRIAARATDGSGDAGANSGGSGDDKAPSGNATADEKKIERPQGQSQLDYLRRLATRLHTMDENARRNGQHGIRAIGVLGSDVYDKLIVLQALRPAFPDALFFTTDLDARLLHPLELDWTRSLLIASSFGLGLAPPVQAGIPPFRDAYQSALYVATLIALTNVRDPRCLAGPSGSTVALCPVNQERIDHWRAQPRLFEVGRHGPFDLSRDADRGTGNPGVLPTGGDECAANALGNCVTIHPHARTLVPPAHPLAWRMTFLAIAFGLIALALVKGAGLRIREWANTSIARRSSSRQRGHELQWIAAGLGVLALLVGIAYVLPDVLVWVAGLLTQRGQGVPMTLLDGVSVWPTELIRAFALAVAFWLIYRGWRNLDANLDYVSSEMRWERERKALEMELAAEYAAWRPWQRFLHVFSFRLAWDGTNVPGTGNRPRGDPDRQAPVDPATGLRPEAEEFWRRYLYQGRIRARLLRIVTAILLYFVFAFAVSAIFGFPEYAIRGTVARRIDSTLVLVAVVTIQFLIFFVVDATVLCRQFVSAISRRSSPMGGRSADDFDEVGDTTRWPLPTLQHFAQKLNVDVRYVDQWVTIHVIGLRTKAVSRLIYYPYIVISLMIVARSAVFDNWAMPIALIIILGTSVLIVTTSAVALRMAAEYARRKAVWRLTNELIRLNSGNDADQRGAKQLEIMIGQIQKYDTGSFASYLNQPLVRAIMLPLGSAGGASLLQYLTIWNF